MSVEPVLQEVLDHLAIRDVSSRYTRFADAADGPAFADLFTEDGTFDVNGDKVYSGRAEIIDVVCSHKEVVHITTDPIVAIEGDTAHQTSRLLLFHRPLDRSACTFVSTGMYIDQFVRTPTGWKFKNRRVEFDTSFDKVDTVMQQNFQP